MSHLLTHGRLYWRLCAPILLLMVVTAHAQSDTPSPDTLAYVNEEYDLILHSTVDRVSRTVLRNVRDFSISPGGKIAYNRQDEADSDLYIYDPATPDIEPFPLRVTPNVYEYPLLWSPDNALMFIDTAQNVALLWDGVSLLEGAADPSALTRVAPELGADLVPEWKEDGTIVLYTYSAPAFPGSYTRVIWDIASESITATRPYGGGAQQRSPDGSMILMSSLASGIPSVYLTVEDRDGNLLLDIHSGAFAWGGTGYLAYCGIEDGFSRILTIWSPAETWVVARVSYRTAQWQSTGQMLSCNNG